MDIETVIIEITRRCNMLCEHCLRGDAQQKDIDHRYIDSLLEKTNYINAITFTGGEPSLNVEAIEYTLAKCKELGVDVGNFYVATNAQEASDEFILVLMKWYMYCSDNEISQVAISNDDFHEVDEDVRDKLMTLKFAALKYPDGKYQGQEYNINEGRQKENYNTGRDNTEDEFEIDDDRITEGNIYLNCDGDIINGCDWSYENQKKHIICNVDDISIETMQKYIDQ